MEQKFTSIKDFKRIQYLPRLGKVRLGIKVISQKTGKEYPKEVDYFVCPPEVKAVYGEKPKILDVMFPSENQAEVIPYSYKSYGSNQRLKCKGDGEEAIWFNPETKEMEEKKCPCDALEKNECGKRGHLMVILPKVSLGGVYQIDTGSGTNINRILDVMAYWKEMVHRCKCIPLTLERVAEKVGNPANGTMQTHYLFRFSTNLNTEMLNQAIENNRKILAIEYKVEKPIEEGKLDDTPIEIIEDAEIVEEEEKEGELAKQGGIEDILADQHPKPVEEVFYCQNPGCKAVVSPALAEESRKEFNGRVYCFDCQALMRKLTKKDRAKQTEPEKEKKFSCENCGDPVSVAEAGYSTKNCAGKTLCFKCQSEYAKVKAKAKK